MLSVHKRAPDSASRWSARDLVATSLASTGGLRLLETLPSRPQLLVLNYHRIGDRLESDHDQGVFSTDMDGLELQIRAVRKRFTLIRPAEAVEVIEGRRRPTEPLALITFDDGYRDNLTNAFPVLRANDVTAIFFVVTSFADSTVVPWWDRLAQLARRCAAREVSVQVPGLDPQRFDLRAGDVGHALRSMLRAYKRASPALQNRLMEELERAAGPETSTDPSRLMLDWHDIRTLRAAGMAIGVHSHSHPILARLTPEEQRREMIVSKAIVEERLGERADFVAYPDGAPGTFDEASKRAAAEAGFRAAFSFSGGTNLAGRIDPFDVRRCAFSPYVAPDRLRLGVDMLSLGSTRWL